MDGSSQVGWLGSDILAPLNQLKLALLSSGRDIIDLSMINPDLPPPRFMLDKLLEASMNPHNHRYSVSRGIRKLRQAFAQKYEERFAVVLDPESQVCVTMGSKDAMMHTLLCVAARGDRVLLAAPTYPMHRFACCLAGLEVDTFRLSTDEQAMLGAIEERFAAQSYRVLLLNFPNNPTGQTVSRNFWHEVLQLAAAREIVVLNDFVYGEMGFGAERPVSLLRAAARDSLALESYSLSKAYSISGWRVGAALGNPAIIQRLARVKAHLDYGIFSPIQIAAAAGLCSSQDLVAPNLKEYDRRCKTLVPGLRALGWEVDDPRCGASVWARLPAADRAVGSMAFISELLRTRAVLAMPGQLFGDDYDDYVRFALVDSVERIAAVLGQLADFRPQARAA